MFLCGKCQSLLKKQKSLEEELSKINLEIFAKCAALLNSSRCTPALPSGRNTDTESIPDTGSTAGTGIAPDTGITPDTRSTAGKKRSIAESSADPSSQSADKQLDSPDVSVMKNLEFHTCS